MMHLSTLWFLIDGIFWIGFFILEGFDFGVGMLHSFVAKDDTERRIAVNSIGPLWDGNEVWLIVAGAVIFAAFPGWYATMFSTFYPALVGDVHVVSHHRQRVDPAVGGRGLRRHAARAAHRQGPQLHRQLLRAPHTVRPLHRGDHAGDVPADGCHLPRPQDHR